MYYKSQFYNILPGDDEAPIDENEDVTASEQEEARRLVKEGTNKDKKDKNPNIPSVIGIGGSKSRKHLSRKRKNKKSYRKRKYGKSKKSRRYRRSVRSRR